MRRLPGGRVTFTISLTAHTFLKVQRAAKREHVSMAEIVRRALDTYFLGSDVKLPKQESEVA